MADSDIIDIDQFRLFLIADKQGKAIANSVKTILETVYTDKKIPAMYVADGFNAIPLVRGELFKFSAKYFSDYERKPITRMRGFMIDSDIGTNFAVADLLKFVQEADRKHYNFVIPYALPVRTSIMEKQGNDYVTVDAEKVRAMKDWQKINAAGLGFYYGDLPLTYDFHFTNHGEDLNFFIENKINLRIVTSLSLYHMRETKLVIS